MVKLPDGTTKRIFGTPTLNTKNAAIDDERAHVQRTLKGEDEPRSPSISRSVTACSALRKVARDEWCR